MSAMSACVPFPEPAATDFGRPVLHIAGVETLDLDQNGRLDHVRIEFTEAVNDASFPGSINAGDSENLVTTEWKVHGYNGVYLDGSVEADVAGDRVLYLAFEEGSPDTGRLPSVYTSSSPGLKSAEGAALQPVKKGTHRTVDGAPPWLLGAQGRINQTGVRLRFSEPVEAATGAAVSSDVLQYNDNGSGAGQISSLADNDASDSMLGVVLNSAVSADDFDNDTIEVRADRLVDRAGHLVATAPVSLSGSVNHSIDGVVNTVVAKGGKVYAGGGFSRIGVKSGPVLFVEPGLEVLAGHGAIYGGTSFSMPDQTGGVYSHLHDARMPDGSETARVFRFNSDGSMHTWRSGVVYNGTGFGVITSGALTDDYLIIAGLLDSIDAVPVSGIAALDRQTGEPLNWGPDEEGLFVYSVAVYKDLIYAAVLVPDGSGGMTSYLTAFELATGKMANWKLHANSGFSAILKLQAVDDTLYLGGFFTSIDGQARNHLAALDLTADVPRLTDWNPAVLQSWNDPDETMLADLLVYDGTLYFAGQFYHAGGQSRNNLAALDLASGTLSAFNPDVTGIINKIAHYEGMLVLGGNFTQVGGQPRSALALVDLQTGQLKGTDLKLNASVQTLATTDSNLFAGGYFNNYHSASAGGLAEIDLNTGRATSFDGVLDGNQTRVSCLEFNTDGSVLYVGGSFTSILGQLRSNLAAVNTADNTLQAWSPDADNEVVSLQAGAGVLYAGGYFTSVGGAAREYLAGLDMTTAAATAFAPVISHPDPAAEISVSELSLSGSTLYIGGWFKSAGGQSRTALAGLDTSTSLATAWNPDPDVISFSRQVNGLAATGAGVFTSLESETYGGATDVIGINALDSSTGSLLGWQVQSDTSLTDKTVNTLLVDDGLIYAGLIDYIGGPVLYRLDEITGELDTDWTPPELDGEVRAIAVSGNRVIVVGTFDYYSTNAAVSNLLILDKETGRVVQY